MDHTQNRIHVSIEGQGRIVPLLVFKRCCFRMLRPHLCSWKAKLSFTPVGSGFKRACRGSSVSWITQFHRLRNAFFECFLVKQLLKLCQKTSLRLRELSWLAKLAKGDNDESNYLAFWPVDALETCKDRCRARCSSCVLYVSDNKLHSETIATVLVHFENLTNTRNVWGPIPFSPWTMRSGILVGVGMFQSAPSPGSPVKASSSTRTWGGVKFGSSQSATQADFCYRPYSWHFSRITRNTK